MHSNEHDLEIGQLLKLVNDELERRANKEIRTYGVSFAQIRVLGELMRAPTGRLTLKELEARAGVSQPTMWGVVSRVEEKGLVTTSVSTNDARAKEVVLTNEGRALCKKTIKQIRATESLLSSDLTADETAEFKRLLAKVHTSLKQAE